jgi:hypothetical protein
MTRREALTAGVALIVPRVRAAESGRKSAERLRLRRVPDGGIQPQVVSAGGNVHLLYYSGDALHGNVFYTRSADGGSTFSPAVQVNSQPGSALAAGTIRGAQLALGKAGRIHVAWNGSSESDHKGPVNPDSGKPGAPMLYARSNDAGTAFERERNLMHRSFGLDGGGTVAADRAANVFVAWHAIPGDAKSGAGAGGEARRQVWFTNSDDDGRTFRAEHPAWQKATGACGCCGMKAFAGRSGVVYALYRSATEGVHRDIYLISSNDHGNTFEGSLLHKWDINACPMSSMDFAENSNTVVAAWETGGQVYWTRIDSGRSETMQLVSAPGEGKGRKHPRLAINERGEVLFVWTEGTGWQRGGSLAWQLYDASGQVLSNHGRAEGIPSWSFAAPAVHPDGSFSIFY